MIVLGYLALFLAGALLCNAIPHLASGLTGVPFPTPFAKPRGVGESPPLTNVLWGAANLFAGSALTWHFVRRLDAPIAFPVMAAGFLAIGAYLARHFGKVRAKR